MAGNARSDLVDPDEVAVFHCTSRCVRRAFLCGEDDYTGQSFEHRKMWIEEMCQYMAKYFALDIISIAVMSNHMHQILRTRPDVDVRRTNSSIHILRCSKLWPV